MAANGVPVESETQTKNDSDSKNCRESSKSIISPTSISFRWLDILEKEFDTAFVDLSVLITDLENQYEELDICGTARKKLEILASAYAQLVHKTLTISQHNAKLEAECVGLKAELMESRAKEAASKVEITRLIAQLHQMQLRLFEEQGNSSPTSERIRQNLEEEVSRHIEEGKRNQVKMEELCHLQDDNRRLRNLLLALQSEIYGARLAAKYLDKELAGRIQQIQLLARELRGPEHDRMWGQLEGEIHLHRHKTVIRACQNRTNHFGLPNHDLRTLDNLVRRVIIHKNPHEGLGMSITGGQEHGVPILISELQPDGPAGRSGELFVGDAILVCNGVDISQAMHKEAVEVLTHSDSPVTLDVKYVAPDSDGDEELLHPLDPTFFKYKMFDDEVVSNSSKNNLFPVNGTLESSEGEGEESSPDGDMEASRKTQNHLDPEIHSHPSHDGSEEGGASVSEDARNPQD